MSWRKQQLQEYYQGNGIIEQDSQLIDFVKRHNIKRMAIVGEKDLDYFQERLPGVALQHHFDHRDEMLAFIPNNLDFNFEEFTGRIRNILALLKTKYVYIAINKYTVVTKLKWPNLTDDYDADLLNVCAHLLQKEGYQELKRSYKEDRGQYFNFVHPTTNAYYERIDSTNNKA